MRFRSYDSIRFVRALLLCVPLLMSSASAEMETAAADYEHVKQIISELIRKEMGKHDVTGLSIALVDDQKVVWAQGFGYADREKGIPASPETVYRAGSISKLFTVTAVMQLAEQGKMDIDKPLQTYLPEFSMRTRFQDAGPITLRSIMTHHSGLPSDFLKGMWTKSPEPFTNLVHHIKDGYVACPPDVFFSYSNLAMTLLGHAVEKTAGRDFAGHMTESVLLPLGMDRSAFSHRISGKAYKKGKEVEEPALRDLPAGGLNSTVLDLGRFIQMVFADGKSNGRQILKPESVKETLRPQNAGVPLDLDFRVGLGWMLSGVDIRNAGPVAYHTGGTINFSSQLIILPEHKLGAVVMANSFGSRGMVNKVAEEALKLALDAKAGIAQPPNEKIEESGQPLPPPEAESYAGVYATSFGLAEITNKSGSLRAEAMNKTFRLVPRADGRLGMKYRLFGIFTISLGMLDKVGLSRAVVEGRELLTARYGGRDMLIGEKIKPVPIPEAWLRRIGEYEIENSGDDYILADKIVMRREYGFLVIEYSVPVVSGASVSMALAPLSDTEAVISGLGRGAGETIRVIKKNGEEMLSYSGYELRKKNE